MNPTQLQLTYPAVNGGLTFVPSEFEYIMNEFCPGYKTMDPEFQKKSVDNYLEHYKCFSQHINRMHWFGHTHILESFVEPGQLTTRHDIHIGFINEVVKRTPHLSESEVVYCMRYYDECRITTYEIMEMPDVTELLTLMDRCVQRFPPPTKRPLRREDIKSYIKKIMVHLPRQWMWILKSRERVPQLKAPKKPYLRVISLEHTDRKIVFVDELKAVLETMGKKKPDKMYSVPYDHQHSYHHFMYIPEEYLDYALSLFGCTRDDLQLIEDRLLRQFPQFYVPMVGPTSLNVLMVDNIFFRMIRYYVSLKTDPKRKDIVSIYHQFLKTGYPLPYFATYSQGDASSSRAAEAQRNYDVSMANMLRSPRPRQKKKELLEHKAEPRTEPMDQTRVRDMLEIFPEEFGALTCKILWEYPLFALLLHEQGWCKREKNFCFAEVFKVETQYTDCVLSVDAMHKRIDFVMKYDFRQAGVRNIFMKKLQTEYRVNPHVVQKTQNESEEEESDAHRERRKKKETTDAPKPAVRTIDCAGGTADTPVLPARRDSGNGASASPSPPAGAVSGNEAVNPEGTESSIPKRPLKANGTVSPNHLPQNNRSKDIDAVEKHHAETIKRYEEDNNRVVGNLKNTISTLQNKMEDQKKTIESQKTEIKELKDHMCNVAKNRKEEIDQITCTLKRVTAEKNVLETEHLTLKTQKTMENQDGALAELRKTESKLRKQLDSSAETVKQRECEIELLKKRVEKIEAKNAELQSQKAVLSDCLDEEKTKFEALMATHTTELEEVHAVYEGRRLSSNENNMGRELERVQREASNVSGVIREMEVLRTELDEVKESCELLAMHSTPACVAAVKRIEVLKRQLMKVQQDERYYTLAEATMDEYVLLEEPDNWAMITNARGHLTMAQQERIRHENELMANIETIRRNVPQYFLLHDCHVDFMNPYPQPFTQETYERLRVLRADPAAVQRMQDARNPRPRDPNFQRRRHHSNQQHQRQTRQSKF